jgi:hypothetical protein
MVSYEEVWILNRPEKPIYWALKNEMILILYSM